MSWINIPNATVLAFTGKPLKSQKLNDDLDYVYKTIRCPAEGCDYVTSLLREWRDHVADEHPKQEDLRVNLEPEMEDRTVAWLILEILLAFSRPSSQEQPNLLRHIQRANDGMHVNELWRRAWNCRDRAEVKLKKDQYDWLQQFLGRMVPLAADAQVAKAKREQGVEQQTVAMHLFGVSEDAVRQALTTLPDRRPPKPPDEEESSSEEEQGL